MPAAAVIPAPIAYIKVVAVKKLVVGSRVRAGGSFRDDTARPGPTCRSSRRALR